MILMAKAYRFNLLGAGAGSMMSSMVISGFLLGYLTDYWLGTLPLFLLLFGLLGIIGGGQKAHKLLSHPEFNRREKTEKRGPKQH
jgi:ATP synthase protein I